MKYAEIKYADIANGIGVRTSLFVSGCTHHCPGCFNEIAWDFAYGKDFTQDTIDEILKSIEQPYVHGLSLLGGEPLDPHNQQPLLALLKEFKQRFPKKNIWCYTGYIFPDDFNPGGRAYTEYTKAFLECLDVLVDGPWLQDEADITLRFRGSKNQRIIDMPESLKQGKTITINYDSNKSYRK